MNERCRIILFFFLLVTAYSVLLSSILERPISFSTTPQLFFIGLILEFIGLILSIYFILQFYKKYGFYNTLSFFVPLFLVGAVVEGDWIIKQRFVFRKLNFYFWDVPIVIILYYSGAHLLYSLYQKLGRGWFNRLKAAIIHLLADSLITTPLAILFGFWAFRSTLFNTYPYIVPVVHLGEVSLGFLYVLFQERFIVEKRIREEWKPFISLTIIFILLLIYSFTSHYFDMLI